MTQTSDATGRTPAATDPREVLRSVWSTEGSDRTALDDCGPQQNCRNMRHVTFDDLAEPGTDLATSWRERLRREGKLGSGSLRDLVLGAGSVDQRVDELADGSGPGAR
jgi:hypothetical protein